ncbi:class I SAM-dependent methyltransferase, partial [Bacillus altitudinis]|uniref:class I SAM-dependent methyltransferase n=1 Tax=Bacillus altitudinis TaxID=293387 RepID=UPI0023545B6B
MEPSKQLIHSLNPPGLILLLIYHPHPQPKKHNHILLHYSKTLHHQQLHLISYQYINIQNHPPFLLPIQKN